MSLHLQRQIENLKKLILSLGALVEESVAKAIVAVDHRDPAMANSVIESDGKIDLMELDVEEECLHTLALHQPVAFDLRFVVAVLKINNDLERIADLAVNIAEQANFMALNPPIKRPPFDLMLMAQKVRAMLKDSLDSLVNIDPTLASSVRDADDDVDQMHRQMYSHVEQGVRQSPELVEQYINQLSISRNLERIADHTVNIAEDVIYMAKGDILRHARRNRKTL